MLRASFVVLCALLCLNTAANAQNVTDVEIEKVLQLGVDLQNEASKIFAEKLPPSGRADGEAVLDALRSGLDFCEKELRSDKLIPKYRDCVTSLQRLTMTSLGELAATHWPNYATSGASRLSLFW